MKCIDLACICVSPKKLMTSTLGFHLSSAFPIQRRSDITSSGTDLLASLLPESIRSVDASCISTMLEAANGALALVVADRLRQLILVAGSAR